MHVPGVKDSWLFEVSIWLIQYDKLLIFMHCVLNSVLLDTENKHSNIIPSLKELTTEFIWLFFFFLADVGGVRRGGWEFSEAQTSKQHLSSWTYDRTYLKCFLWQRKSGLRSCVFPFILPSIFIKAFKNLTLPLKIQNSEKYI